MNALILFLSTCWSLLTGFLSWVRTILPYLFNKIWAAGLLMVGVIWSMMHYASVALGTIADKLDQLNLTTVDGHAPSGGGTDTIMTIRGWLELGNAVFPINEGFTYLVGYLSLLAALLIIGFLWKLISSIF